MSFCEEINYCHICSSGSLRVHTKTHMNAIVYFYRNQIGSVFKKFLHAFRLCGIDLNPVLDRGLAWGNKTHVSAKSGPCNLKSVPKTLATKDI